MKTGKEYLVGLNEAPAIEPEEGGWALIRYDTGGSTAVSPVVTTRTPWARSVHIFALGDGPDPVLDQDQLVYRNEAGEGESRIIVSFALLG